MFQDANVKLIRELREEIRRLKAMLLSFELVGHYSELVYIQEALFFCIESEPCFVLCSQLSDACRAGAGAKTDGYCYDYLCSFTWDGHPLTTSLLSKGHLPKWLLFSVWADTGNGAFQENFFEFFCVPFCAQILMLLICF